RLQRLIFFLLFFTYNAHAPTEIYTLSLHDALPICKALRVNVNRGLRVLKKNALPPPVAKELRRARVSVLSGMVSCLLLAQDDAKDRKSTRLNSSHVKISYAVFCLKKKKKNKKNRIV